ncbi:3-hydroxyacyl-CoA dehydrogenase family protein [Peribacillus deserti]|uniref:3-hydroxybutyryl-CoA dehydrogenase n=1 Tax=Peribacillus deserti TaxID=673318 RepID=A0A2N5M6X8_9BACI|nr:3-hydroxyacyl-CoA dehydrogenase NAD-binding domain-containing protein [Peribacillus deserti]PLT30053.1 3-hydroxybutyryl-CoA dehydrogenase [Peribacillus deserti]
MEEQVAVIGCGTMGHSIALSAALAGFTINMWGYSQADLVRAKKDLEEKIQVLARYQVIEVGEIAPLRERVRFTQSLEDCIAGATFIIEAIPETLSLKQEWYKKLDALCDSSVILASNTSGLSPTEIAKYTNIPERTVVTHFWNPGHLIPLVEIVRGKHTSDETVERSLHLLSCMKKKPIVVQKEIPGAIGNRLQYALFREAQYILEQGAATVEDIDAAVRYSIGRRLPVTGPFMTADMGGLDVFGSISSYLFPDLSSHSESLQDMKGLVDEGNFGQKNGRGFYEWPASFSTQMNDERERELISWLKKDLEEYRSI